MSGIWNRLRRRLRFCPPPMRRARRARGYNIVELATVLVASGLFISGGLYSFIQVQKNHRIAEANRQIETIKGALVNYAARHRTLSRPVALVVSPLNSYGGLNLTLPTQTLNFRTIGGLPYLPCPDFDGDGLEDRAGTFGPPSSTLTVEYNENSYGRGNLSARGNPLLFAQACQFRGRPTALTLGSSARDTASNQQGWRRIGSALASDQRGMLPWRTLGLSHMVDPWGNYYTYYVHGQFSSPYAGIGRKTRAAGDSRVAMQVVESDLQSSHAAALAFGIRTETAPLPGMVCTTPLTATAAGDLNNFCPRFAIGQPASNVAAQVEDVGVLQGRRIKNPLTTSSAGVADAWDGAPFVIVSHGPNGNGAIAAPSAPLPQLYDHSLASASPGTNRLPLLTCRPSPVNPGERQNAMRIFASSVPLCPKITSFPNAGANRGVRASSPAFFVTGVSTEEFDDIVSWMSVPELQSELGRLGAFGTVESPIRYAFPHTYYTLRP